MTEILTVPLKRGTDVDLLRPLTRWIAATFSTADSPIDCTSSISELHKMRQGVARLTDRGEAGLLAASNYYDQIAALEGKIPVNELQIPFKWKDAFDRGSIFGGRLSLSVPTLAYEKVCVLFNIGAFNGGVAADQNLESSDGLQKALKKLQVAAGVFSYLKENVVAAIQQDPTPDMEPATLTVLADLMLAQAQEMVACKAMNDKMKDAIIAKLCAQCDELFSNVMRSMQKEEVKNLWDSDWLPVVSGKQAIYNGLAQYHQSRVCNEQKSIGEEIARLEYAKKLFTAGMERGSVGLCNAKDWLKRTERALTDAKKDNDFIYHERIPEERQLAAVAKAAVAKPSPLAAKLGNPDAPELFESLVPVAVHQALAAYELRKSEIVNKEVDKLKEATNLANQLLSSMNLPAALEDTKGNELPQSLKDKSLAVKDAGGTDLIRKLIEELPELLIRNTEILDECERLLQEEKESDDQLRSQFKEKWNRTPSEKLTATFNSNATKYRTIINNATQADKVVREKFDTHKSFMDMLSGGPNSLESSVPSGGGSNTAGLPIAQKLREQLEDVETIKAERAVIESEIKATKPDMKSVFSKSFTQDGVISEEQMSLESLGRAFGPLQQQSQDNIKRQDTLMTEIQKNHEIFIRESGGGTNDRDEVLKQLAAANDAYFELKGNLQEGTKFYNDLTQLLVTFQSKVTDFTFARKTEKEELMKDLTSGMSSMSLAATPTPPAHHTASAPPSSTNPERPPRKADDRPPRPPPPSTTANTYSAAPATNPYAGAPTTASSTTQAPNPYAGAPPGANPYAGAPSNPYAGAPAAPGQNPNLPYPVQAPNMPMPGYPPQPAYAPGMPPPYNPYAPVQASGYPGYPQYPAGAPQQQYPGYPAYPQQPGQPPYQPYPGQPGQQPQWRQ